MTAKNDASPSKIALPVVCKLHQRMTLNTSLKGKLITPTCNIKPFLSHMVRIVVLISVSLAISQKPVTQPDHEFGARAFCCVPVFIPALINTHYAYPRKANGHAQLNSH